MANKNKITLVGILQVFQAVSCSLNGWFMARISCDMDQLISKFCLHKTNVKLIYLEEQVELNNLRLISCSGAHKSTEQAQGRDQNERFWDVNPVCLSECELPWSHWGHCRQSFVVSTHVTWQHITAPTCTNTHISHSSLSKAFSLRLPHPPTSHAGLIPA